MIDRRTFIGAVAGALAALPSVVNGQSGRTYRLGVLHPARLEPLNPYSYTVLLGELGYIEGRNLHVERR